MISYHSPTVLQEIVGFPVTPPFGAAEADKNNKGRYSVPVDFPPQVLQRCH